ncbi:MAG: biotin/lipoyl-containing protein, partial [Myxococcota bacterium]
AVAEGEPLPEFPDDVFGHAIEARIYAEDPYDGFKPQVGTLHDVIWPANPGVRVDAGVHVGQSVSTDYDPMLAKIIAVGETREQARMRLLRALEDTVVFGVGTNTEFLCDLLDDPVFALGDARTNWLDENPREEPDRELARALGALLVLKPEAEGLLGGLGRSARLSDGAQVFTARIYQDTGICLAVGDSIHRVGAVNLDSAELDGVRYRFDAHKEGEAVWVTYRGSTLELRRAVSDAVTRSGAADGKLRSPIAGKVVQVLADVGATVESGQTLIVIEAMKMEHELRADSNGVLRSVQVSAGVQVDARQILAEIET